MKLIQLTDLHLVPPGGRIAGFDPSAHLRAAIADIAAHHADAALCLLTGDLANEGDVATYTVLRECLAALPIPWRLLAGNHDDRAHLLQVFPETATDASGFLQSRAELPGARVLLLDTLEPGDVGGRLCERRLAWLDTELAAAGALPVYVFLHHPPCAIGISALDRIALRDAAALAAVLERHGNVRHLFCGHVHRPVAGSWRGIPLSALPSTNHQFALDLRPEQPLAKIGESPAYGVILIEADRTLVHTHSFMGGRPAPI